MKWLHLSDPHFDPDNAGLNTAMLRKALPGYLRQNGITADHLFCTGDFRHARRQRDTDEVAGNAAAFLLEIARCAGVTGPGRIHIVPGNHDLTLKKDSKERVPAIRQRYESDQGRPEGCFTPEERKYLWGRFGFFRRVVKALGPAGSWPGSARSLHPHACHDTFSLVYMNSAIACGASRDRGDLVVGSMGLYEALSALAEASPGKPVIILAHHSPQYFSAGERRKLEAVFRQFADTALYLCGDEHSPWSRSVNTVPYLTAGCLVQEGNTEVVFYTGELRDGRFLSPRAHSWDRNLSRWGEYAHANEEMEEKLAGCRFFSAPAITGTTSTARAQITPAASPSSNLDALDLRLSLHFTGRGTYLERIRETFREGSGAVSLVQSVSGLGGVGKTQIALKYAYDHEKDYTCVWWMDASDENAILDGYKRFLAGRGLLADPLAPPDLVIRTAREWMTGNDDWLFVFDNADAEAPDGKRRAPDAMLKAFLPARLSGNRHVLITSRYTNWQGTATGIDITVFSPEEAARFLTGVTGLPADRFQAELALALGCLPLALEQAAAYINATRIGYERYFELFSGHGAAMLQRHPNEDDPKRIVYTTWDISRQRITKESALQLLDLLAFFAPDNIYLDWFRKGVKHLPEPLAADIRDDLSCEDMLAELLRYSLITRHGDGLSLHRLLQAVIRDSLDEDGRNAAAECCLRICETAAVWDFSTLERRRAYAALQPHTLTVIALSGEDCLPEARAGLYMFLGIGAHEHGRYNEALEWFARALAIREKVLGEAHPGTADAHNNIAIIYDNTGNYDKALEWYKKALAIRESVLGKEHPDTADTYNNIANVYNNAGNYDKALEWYRKALAIRVKVLGEKHPDTAAAYNNIANVYNKTSKYAKALEYLEKALSIREKALGKKHPETAGTYNNIANVYNDTGKYDEALEWHGKALAIRKKVLGKEHPDTAATYNNIANVYNNTGKYAKALKWHKRALNAKIKVLGEEHPDTAATYNNIAGVYFSTEEYDSALKCFEKALAVKERALGKEHPSTANTYNNIANVHCCMGEYDKALEWYEKALAVKEVALGEEHPVTANTYNNIASVYSKIGEYDKALEWFEKALAVVQKTLGEEHPSTLITYKNIAMAHENTGDYDKALEYYLRASRDVAVELGANHPHIRTFYGNLRQTYKRSGKPEAFADWLAGKGMPLPE